MTRPSASLNWYEPGESGIVPAGGRVTMHRFWRCEGATEGQEDRHDPRGARRLPRPRADLPGGEPRRRRLTPRDPALVRVGRRGPLAQLAHHEPALERPRTRP